MGGFSARLRPEFGELMRGAASDLMRAYIPHRAGVGGIIIARNAGACACVLIPG